MVAVRHGELAGGVKRGERRVGLDGELVEREMLGRLGDGARELGAPGRRGLARPRIDEVERIALERAARDRDGGERLVGRVHAPERLERGVVERLHAERHPVDAGGAVARETASPRRSSDWPRA